MDGRKHGDHPVGGAAVKAGESGPSLIVGVELSVPEEIAQFVNGRSKGGRVVVVVAAINAVDLLGQLEQVGDGHRGGCGHHVADRGQRGLKFIARMSRVQIGFQREQGTRRRIGAGHVGDAERKEGQVVPPEVGARAEQDGGGLLEEEGRKRVGHAQRVGHSPALEAVP